MLIERYFKSRIGVVGAALAALVAVQGLAPVASATERPVPAESHSPVSPPGLPPVSPGQPVGPAVSTIASCLNNRGLIDIEVVNDRDDTATYQIEAHTFFVAKVWRRTRTVKPQEEGKASFTVMANSPLGYDVTVHRNGELIYDEVVSPQCKNPTRGGRNGPAVTVVNACRNGDGYIRTYFVNLTTSATNWSVQLKDRLDPSARVPERIRWTPSEARGVVAITGRPDGEYEVVVYRRNTPIYTKSVSVKCDRTPGG